MVSSRVRFLFTRCGESQTNERVFELYVQFALPLNIEDITCPRVDTNFIFECSTRYLTSERSERVRYRVDHEKIKFVSTSGHVRF